MATRLRSHAWLLAVLLGLAYVALALVARSGLLPGDASLAAWLQETEAGTAAHVYGVLNRVGELPIWDSGVVAAAVVLWLCGRRRAGLLLVSGLGVELLTVSSKWLVDRPRPAADGFLDTASFPSGHLARVTVTLGLLVALFVWRQPAWRWPALLVAGGVLVLWSAARVASGAHWPSDVLGGTLLGGCWLAVLLAAARRIGRHPERNEGTVRRRGGTTNV